MDCRFINLALAIERKGSIKKSFSENNKNGWKLTSGFKYKVQS